MVKRWLRDDVLTAVGNLEPIAAEMGVSMAQLALAWVLANENVSSAIIGATRPEQVTDNVRAVDLVLDADLLARIDASLGDVVEFDASLTAAQTPPIRPRVAPR